MGPPEQYLATVNSPTLRGRALKRYQVIITESAEHLIDKVLTRMAARQRPYENTGVRIELDLNTHFVIKRTFIQPAQHLLLSGITESTTEAVRTGSSMSSSYFSPSEGSTPAAAWRSGAHEFEGRFPNLPDHYNPCFASKPLALCTDWPVQTIAQCGVSFLLIGH